MMDSAVARHSLGQQKNMQLSVRLDPAQLFQPLDLWPSLVEELSLHCDVLAEKLVHATSACLGLFLVHRSVKPHCIVDNKNCVTALWPVYAEQEGRASLTHKQK